jgi:signal transduction histidine kinase
MENLPESLMTIMVILMFTHFFMTILSYFVKREHHQDIFQFQFKLWLGFTLLVVMNPPTTNPQIIALNVLTWGFPVRYIILLLEKCFGLDLLRTNYYKEFAASCLVGASLALSGFSFMWMTLPPVLYICIHLIYSSYEIFRAPSERKMDAHEKLALFFILLFAVHGLSYPFNRLDFSVIQYDFIVMAINTLGFAIVIPSIVSNTFYRETNGQLIEQVKFEEEIVKTMVVTVNHELNTPLAVLQANLELAKKSGKIDHVDGALKSIGEISAVIKKISSLGNDNLNKKPYRDLDADSNKMYSI